MAKPRLPRNRPMRVRLEYGRKGLDVELPDRNVVKCLKYQPAEPLAEPAAEVVAQLRSPTGSPPLSEF